MELQEIRFSEKSAAFINQLKEVPQDKKFETIFKAWDEGKQDKEIILDAFHVLLKEAFESDSLKLNLEGDFLNFIVEQSLALNRYFVFETPLEYKNFITGEGKKCFVEEHLDEIQLAVEVAVEKLASEGTEANLTPMDSSSEVAKPAFEFPENFDDELLNKLKEIGTKVHNTFLEIREHQKVMKDAEQTLRKFQKKLPDITQDDVLNAKKRFNDAKPNFVEKAKLINEDIAWVYSLYRKFNSNLMLHKAYNSYLAKLLAAQDGRNPIEQYVLKIAEEEFVYENKEFQVTEDDQRMGRDLKWIIGKYNEELTLVTNRLEARYEKRQIMTRMMQGEQPEKLVNKLKKILEKDPDDIKTYILLARIMTDLFWKIKDHIHRLETRQVALAYCEDAFSNIDTYLDLQGIQEISQRDHIRVGFIKTISAIRNPLVK